MNQDQKIEKINEMFNSRYKDLFIALNNNVYITDSSEVPAVVVGEGGGTLSVGKESFSLRPPAEVSVVYKKKQPLYAVYRISVPYTEISIAAEKPEYFNYLFDGIMLKAIANYNTTFGGADKMRWGQHYCKNDKIKLLDSDNVELRLFGTWASDEDMPTVTLNRDEAV